MKCPHCHQDIAEQVVVSAAARIMAKRSRGYHPTPEQARAMQARSVEARRANKQTQEVVKEPD